MVLSFLATHYFIDRVSPFYPNCSSVPSMFVLYLIKLLLESVGELWCRRQMKVRFAWDMKFSERVGSSFRQQEAIVCLPRSRKKCVEKGREPGML